MDHIEKEVFTPLYNQARLSEGEKGPADTRHGKCSKRMGNTFIYL